MAKRFTDTTKWDRENFRKLSPLAKLAWFYVTDRCDNCGIWHPDFGLMSFQLGEEITREDFLRELGHKVVALPNGAFFIPSFIEFQYGELKPDCNAHKPVIAALAKHGLELSNPIPTVPEQFMNSTGSVPGTLQDKDKDKDLIKGGVGEKRNAPAPAFDWAAVYREYPRHQGKAAGIKALEKKIRDPVEYEAVLHGVRAYAAECRREGREKKYIAQFSTFVNQERWKDYQDQEPRDDGMLRYDFGEPVEASGV